MSQLHVHFCQCGCLKCISFFIKHAYSFLISFKHFLSHRPLISLHPLVYHHTSLHHKTLPIHPRIFRQAKISSRCGVTLKSKMQIAPQMCIHTSNYNVWTIICMFYNNTECCYSASAWKSTEISVQPRLL